MESNSGVGIMTKITYKLEKYEGPLDLILSLVNKNKMEIKDIRISEIFEQYMAYVEQAKEIDMDYAGEFITMAAELMYIKSKMLLPQQDEEDPREELVRQLMEYKSAKEAAKTLSERENEFSGRFEKDTVEIKPEIGEDTRIDLSLLTKALANVFARAAEEIKRKEMMKIPNIPIVKRKHRTVEGSAVTILKKMVKRKAVHFDDLFEGAEDRTDIISIFYALLELLRVGRITLERADDFDKTDSNVILRLNTEHTRDKKEVSANG